MASLHDVPASRLTEEVAKELKALKTIRPPKWSIFVKTGTNREKQPADKDWWYLRSASVLRKVHLEGPIGIPTLRRIYGGKGNRGVKPDARRRGSGAVIKHILNQLEKEGLVKKTKRGRVTTPAGVSLLDKTATRIKKEIPGLEKY
ncbi:MAG: 30S ribosomal protein S19e [Euryarchaeota archaeon]|nr:30S ribosomal protein S19e [Euryarchaeota archaeon]